MLTAWDLDHVERLIRFKLLTPEIFLDYISRRALVSHSVDCGEELELLCIYICNDYSLDICNSEEGKDVIITASATFLLDQLYMADRYGVEFTLPTFQRIERDGKIIVVSNDDLAMLPGLA